MEQACLTSHHHLQIRLSGRRPLEPTPTKARTRPARACSGVAEQRVGHRVSQDVLRVELALRLVELGEGEAHTQPLAHNLDHTELIGHLDLGPVLVAVVLGPQQPAAHVVVLPELGRDRVAHALLLGRQVHDDAHPRMQVVLAGGVRGAHLGDRTCGPPLLDGSRHGEWRGLRHSQQLVHEAEICVVRAGARATRERDLRDPLLAAALKP
mmetsp:Transcript_27561/g.72859  ORF Transcript_27561/g.72859 Transcript_27561/m.72859 type:complete len:210 (-) Transcript_27561:738-1367(-)